MLEAVTYSNSRKKLRACMKQVDEDADSVIICTFILSKITTCCRVVTTKALMRYR